MQKRQSNPVFKEGIMITRNGFLLMDIVKNSNNISIRMVQKSSINNLRIG
jgi:hypothetical protein